MISPLAQPRTAGDRVSAAPVTADAFNRQLDRVRLIKGVGATGEVASLPALT